MLERGDRDPKVKGRRFQEELNQIEIVSQLFHITIRLSKLKAVDLVFSYFLFHLYFIFYFSF